MATKTKPKYNPRPDSKPGMFLALARPDKNGYSRMVTVEDLKKKYPNITWFGNGGDFVRRESPLAKHYNIRLYTLKDGKCVRKDRGRPGVIYAVELHGYNKNPVHRGIPVKIAREIKKSRCAVLSIGNVEVDHRDGRLDDPSLLKNPTVDDFQPLSKAANNAKRQHCKDCKKTGRRFDATVLGYTMGQWIGNGVYEGTCVGCYWHCPITFNREMSASFKKEFSK